MRVFGFFDATNPYSTTPSSCGVASTPVANTLSFPLSTNCTSIYVVTLESSSTCPVTPTSVFTPVP